MTGLRSWARDRTLPALAGDEALVPPSDRELADLVAEVLATAPPVEVTACQLVYARWKPRVSVSACFEVQLADGSEHLVHLKRYAGDKAAEIAGRVPTEWRTADDAPLRPAVVQQRSGLCLFTFPADRMLPGLERVLAMSRNKRLLAELGLFPGWRLRSHRSSARLLRYRPEKRAVFRLDVTLRDADRNRRSERLAARVLPPAVADRVARMRGRCPLGARAPALLGCQERTGILLEEWLDGETRPPDRFDHAAGAARLLAGLHALSAAPDAAPAATLSDLAPLFAWHDALNRLAAGVLDPEPQGPTTWVHGDFHPDQVLRGVDGTERLLDLDALAGGCPANDLASWIADHLVQDETALLEEVAGPLAEGYRAGGGAWPEESVLAAAVAAELVRRAAACLRRLEQGAVERAGDILRLARQVAPSGAVFP